jgi:hypothetical protein
VEAVVHGKRFLHVVMKRHALLIGKVKDRNLAAFLVQDAKRGVCSISAEVVDSPKEITSLSEDREGVDRVSGAHRAETDTPSFRQSTHVAGSGSYVKGCFATEVKVEQRQQ